MRLWNTLRYYARQFSAYHIATYAASASFFIITAVFPLLILTLSIVGLTRLSAEDFLEMIAMILPDTFAPMLGEVAADLMTSSATAISLSAVATMWTASKSMLGLMDGLNAIAGVDDTRNFLLKRAMCIVYMLMLIGGLLVNLGLRGFGHRIMARLLQDMPRVGHVFSAVMDQTGLTLFLIVTVVFVLIYTVFPNKKLKFYMQLPGAAFTSLAWMGFSSLFSIYVNRIGRFSTIYGGLTMMILVMLWLYACMYIVFIGAAVNKMGPELFWRLYLRGKRCLAKLRKTGREA